MVFNCDRPLKCHLEDCTRHWLALFSRMRKTAFVYLTKTKNPLFENSYNEQ